VEIWIWRRCFSLMNKIFRDRTPSIYFSLFNEVVSSSDCIPSNVRIVVKINWKRSWPNWSCYFCFILEEMRENTKILSQCTQRLRWVSKRGITEHKPSIIAWPNLLGVTECFLVNRNQFFGRNCSLHFQDSTASAAVDSNAASSSVMLVPSYRTTWRMFQ
jgi:hypothetical protein